jgi:hypothetical protein
MHSRSAIRLWNRRARRKRNRCIYLYGRACAMVAKFIPISGILEALSTLNTFCCELENVYGTKPIPAR